MAKHSGCARGIVSVLSNTVGVLGMAALGCSSEPSVSVDKHETGTVSQDWIIPSVGGRDQGPFQNGYLPSLVMDNMVSNFINYSNLNSGFGDGTTVEGFWYNLHGAKSVLEATNDGAGTSAGSADSVDMLLLATHGGTGASTAETFMWDANIAAVSTHMRLGDNSEGLRALFLYTCDELKMDNAMTGRWAHALAGGLKQVHGAYDLMWDNNDFIGDSLAAGVNELYSLQDAWLNATYDDDNNNHPISMTTGANPDDCYARADGLDVHSFMSDYPALQDGQIGYYCWTWI